MLAATPPMGWNSWNTFGRNIHEDLIKETADALIASGLRDLGYIYVNIDDLWQGERDADGRPQADPAKFPGGMKALGDFLHERGFKFGLYSDAGDHTCGGAFGSYGYETIDAQTYASWGVDYLKYDYCNAPSDRASAIARYTAMGKALRDCGRPIVYSVCEWGDRQPWHWAAQTGAHLWRTTGDIWDSWYDGDKSWHNGIDRVGFQLQRGLEAYAGPGHWNDPDMLIVGMRGQGNTTDNKGCTDDEYRTHFGLWCMLAAPLLIGCDVRKMDAPTRAILGNAELIALDQDPLGKQAFPVMMAARAEVYKKPLLYGELAVGVFNRNHTETMKVRIHKSDLGIVGKHHIRDLWKHEDIGLFGSDHSFTVEVAPHACQIFRLTPWD